MKIASENPSNPVRKTLDEELPDYLPWFTKWRDLRNTIKDGIPTVITGPAHDLGVAIRAGIIAPDVGIEVGIVRLRDVTNALCMSAGVTQIVAAHA